MNGVTVQLSIKTKSLPIDYYREYLRLGLILFCKVYRIIILSYLFIILVVLLLQSIYIILLISGILILFEFNQKRILKNCTKI